MDVRKGRYLKEAFGNFNRRAGILLAMNQELLWVIQQRQDVIKWCHSKIIQMVMNEMNQRREREKGRH